MTPAIFIDVGWIPAMTLLPAKMNSPEARALVVCICLQESRLEHRRQIGGPARGFPQFELGGIRGVLQHRATYAPIRAVLDALGYDYTMETSHTAIEHNDVLACAYARLNLWWLPGALPERNEPGKAWDQYIDAWRPGRPRRDSWDAFYAQAWE